MFRNSAKLVAGKGMDLARLASTQDTQYTYNIHYTYNNTPYLQDASKYRIKKMSSHKGTRISPSTSSNITTKQICRLVQYIEMVNFP